MIHHTIINFENGFHVITGETGSGKSVLFNALSAITGERVHKDFIRKGCEKAEIKAVFLKDSSLEKKLLNKGFSIDDDVVIVERIISKSGRSLIKINGSIQTAQTVRDLCEDLIEICSQREHHSLNNELFFIHLFDALLGKKHQDVLFEYQTLYYKRKELTEKLENLRNQDREQERLLDLYRFQIEEIKSSGLVIGEGETLENEKRALSSFQKISEFIGSSLENLSAVDQLSHASFSLNEAAKYDERLVDFSEKLNSVLYELQDIHNEVHSYFNELEYDEERLNEIMVRLALIQTLKRKYGDSIEEILSYYEHVQTKLSDFVNKDQAISELESEIASIEDEIISISSILEKNRKNMALEVEEKIIAELYDLSMPYAKLFFDFKKQKNFTLYGLNSVSAFFNANKGEDLKPLSKIASGGELSRVLLALKISTNVNNKQKTLLFDEVDEGVGGEVGLKIGEKLRSLGATQQIVSISHLPQVAAKADVHYLISKEIENERTLSHVSKLETDDRKFEIARMIYGDKTNDTTLKQAEEMLKE